MKPFPTLPALLFVLGVALAATVAAQDQPAAPHDVRPPPQDPKIEAALDACWDELDGEADDPVPPELMDQCMQAKGFTRPMGPPPGSHEDAPPPPSPLPSAS